MSAVIAALDAEIAEIEADIAKNPDPRGARLAHLRSVRQHYIGDAAKSAPAVGTPAPTALFSHRRLVRDPMLAGFGALLDQRQIGRRPHPERVRALTAAHEYLQGAVEPVKTSVLLAHLETLSIHVAGEVPVNNLSAMLSNDPRFHANGRSGWTLVKEDAA